MLRMKLHTLAGIESMASCLPGNRLHHYIKVGLIYETLKPFLKFSLSPLYPPSLTSYIIFFLLIPHSIFNTTLNFLLQKSQRKMFASYLDNALLRKYLESNSLARTQLVPRKDFPLKLSLLKSTLKFSPPEISAQNVRLLLGQRSAEEILGVKQPRQNSTGAS
jgi:hypothetical protein